MSLSDDELKNDGFVPVKHDIRPVIENKYFINDSGIIYSKFINDFLKRRIDKDGYWTVSLFDKNGHQKNYKVHTLVAYTFLGNPPKNISDHAVVDHINRDRLCSHVMNLRWVSPLTNLRNRKLNSNKQLTPDDVHNICKDLESHNYNTLDELATKYNVTRPRISSIKTNKTFRNIRNLYNINFAGHNDNLSDEIVTKICEDLTKTKPSAYGNIRQFTIDQISRKYNVHPSCIKSILRHESHCDISDKYQFGASTKNEQYKKRISYLIGFRFGIMPTEYTSYEDTRSAYTIYKNLYEHDCKIDYTLCKMKNDNTSDEIGIDEMITTYKTRMIKTNYTQITDKIVHNICKELEMNPGISITSISIKYKVPENTIQNIKSRRTHKNISSMYNFETKPVENINLPNELVYAIGKAIEKSKCDCYYKEPSKQLKDIAKDFNVNESFVKQIATKKIRSDITKNMDFGYSQKERRYHRMELITFLHDFGIDRTTAFDIFTNILDFVIDKHTFMNLTNKTYKFPSKYTFRSNVEYSLDDIDSSSEFSNFK